uniref:Temporin-AV n=1 Tax=Rana arvalis TaxID=156871 RepID=TPAV_RANAR|nr:RecName: Full=Temporin-AV [Rana arvalis]
LLPLVGNLLNDLL